MYAFPFYLCFVSVYDLERSFGRRRSSDLSLPGQAIFEAPVSGSWWTFFSHFVILFHFSRGATIMCRERWLKIPLWFTEVCAFCHTRATYYDISLVRGWYLFFLFFLWTCYSWTTYITRQHVLFCSFSADDVRLWKNCVMGRVPPYTGRNVYIHSCAAISRKCSASLAIMIHVVRITDLL